METEGYVPQSYRGEADFLPGTGRFISMRSSSGALPSVSSEEIAAMPRSSAANYRRVGGRISSGMESSPLDTAMLGLGVLLGVVGFLMIFLFAANISVDCVLSVSLKDRAFDVCRVRQQSGWVAPGSYWMSHSRSVLVRGMERAVLLASYQGQEVAYGARGRLGFQSRNDLVRVSLTAPGAADDEEDDDHAVDEDILAHSKCLVGVEVSTSGNAQGEMIKLNLIPKPCLGDAVIALLREVDTFIHHRTLPPEDREAIVDGEPSMDRFELHEETGFFPQLVGFGLVLLGATLVLLYNLGGMTKLASLFPK